MSGMTLSEILKLALEGQVEICQEEKIRKCFHCNKKTIWKKVNVCEN